MKSIFDRNDFYNLKYEPTSKINYLKHINFERKKLKFYINIIYKELNLLNNKDYTKKFWSIILDFFLLYHISICRGYYFSINKVKKSAKNYFKILAPKCYYNPKNISDYRNFFQRTELGDEQFFSFFINFFFQKNKIKVFYQKKKTQVTVCAIKKNNFNFIIFKKFISKILRYIIKPRAIITGCYWGEANKVNINLNSNGKILCTNFFIPQNDAKYNFILRQKLLENILINNRKQLSKFDKFFFNTLIFSMPISLLENICYRINYAENFLNNNKNIKIIVNENLSEDNLLLIAASRLRSIKTLYVEHNSLQIQDIGNIINLIKDKFDNYFTLGWKCKNNFFIPAGSNFIWNKNIFYKEYYNSFLFISGIPELKPPYLRSCYSDAGVYNSNKWYSNNITFFNCLSELAKKKLVFKKYPYSLSYLVDKNYKKFISFLSVKKIKFLKSEKIDITPGLISSAKLVIVNNLSTPSLQSLISNVPTIIYYNHEQNYLAKNYKNFHLNLLKANILHKNGHAAAKFINKLVNDDAIHKWWTSKTTQNARKSFLKKNLNLSLNLNQLLIKKINSLC
jgi:putative transferase (TIGR04331 family)